MLFINLLVELDKITKISREACVVLIGSIGNIFLLIMLQMGRFCLDGWVTVTRNVKLYEQQFVVAVAVVVIAWMFWGECDPYQIALSVQPTIWKKKEKKKENRNHGKDKMFIPSIDNVSRVSQSLQIWCNSTDKYGTFLGFMQYIWYFLYSLSSNVYLARVDSTMIPGDCWLQQNQWTPRRACSACDKELGQLTQTQPSTVEQTARNLQNRELSAAELDPLR